MRKYAAILGELLICVGAYAAAVWWWASDQLILESGRLEFAILVATFFLSMQFQLQQKRGTGLEVVLPVLSSTGMTMLAAGSLSYTMWDVLLPLQSLLGGSLLAAIGIVLWRRWTAHWRSPGQSIVLVGQGPLGVELARGIGWQLAGVVSPSPAGVPAGVAYLGSYEQLTAVIADKRPHSIVVDVPDWQRWISPRLLLDYKLRGGKVETSGAMHGRVFQRIHPRAFKLADVLWVETQKANRRVMALQAVYSNLIGLLLLVCSAPVLLGVGVASRLQARAGSMFHLVECAGFQAVPFQLRRFHVRHAVTGELTWIGNLLEHMRLTGLPQLINLVRGEMGLFGPGPVRTEFALYLEQACSLYSYRHSLRPGLFGWARAQYSSHEIQEESLCLAYDLYYSEHVTLVLDLAILVRSAGRILRGLLPGGG